MSQCMGCLISFVYNMKRCNDLFLIYCSIFTCGCYHHVIIFDLSLYYEWKIILASVLLLCVMIGMV